MTDSSNNPQQAKPDSRAGHRKRLREKFIESGLTGFHDYEIIELLLSLGTPRKDCKEPAKEAIKRFKTLRGVLEAPPEELQEISGIGAHNSFGIKLIQEVAAEYLKEKAIEKPVYRSADEVFNYLYHTMRGLKKEVFKVLYLNSQNQIIEAENLFEGTVNSSAVIPREVVEAALKHKAVSVIFAHNHPSGNPEPSGSDREITRDLVYAARTMDIKVLDHLVIGDNRYYSFAGQGLIEEFEIEFTTMKMKRGNKSGRSVTETEPNDLPWSREPA